MMYRSATPPVSKDLNLPYPPPATFSSGHLKDDSESDLPHRQQPQQMSSGLLRFRSAPSSLFGEACEEFPPARPSSPGADVMFARFLTPDLRDKPSVGAGRRDPLFSPPHPVPGEIAAPQMLYHPHRSTVESTFQVVGSMAMEHAEQIKNGDGASSSNLIRHSSSPAGLFSHLNEGSGYRITRGMGDVGDTGSRLSNQLSFSSRQSSIMTQISEMGSEGLDGSSSEERDCRGYLPGFAVNPWEHNSLLQDSSFSRLKRSREDEGKMMGTAPQNEGVRNHVLGPAHQFSLPKTASDMAAMEKFLEFQDAVPCKVRAKRGCATHPRSIAERVRRTRISERIRKLQDIVPNMDKQTNTADMLDLAVDYIKDLQKQVEVLTESRANCTCSASRA